MHDERISTGPSPRAAPTVAAIALAALAFFAGRGPLWAQPPAPPVPGPDDEDAIKPWHRGVSLSEQEVAKTLFKEGAALHREAFYLQAIAKYEEALTHWDHPDISFNMARALRDLRRPVDAYRALKRATRFGAQSLKPEEYARAQELLRELEGLIARIELTCDVQGARVTLDGEFVFEGPGKKEVPILPSPHRFVAERDGYVKDEQWHDFKGGERKTIALKPMSLKRVAFAEVSCAEKGATVILDGRPFMECPQQKTEMLAPDIPHTFIITRPDRIPGQETVTPTPGQRLDITLRTMSKEDLKYRRPMPRWIAWTVFSGGVVVSAIAGALRWSAQNTMDSYDAAIVEQCETGCILDDEPELRSQRDSAHLRNGLAIAATSVAGAAVIAGLALELWNQPRAQKPRQRGSVVKTQAVIIRPSITREEIGIVAGIRF